MLVWLVVQGKGQHMGSTASDPIMSYQPDLSHFLLFVVLDFFLDLSHYLLFKDVLDAKFFVKDSNLLSGIGYKLGPTQ